MSYIWNDHKLLSDIFHGDMINVKEHKLCSLWASYGAIHSIELYIKPFDSDSLIKNNLNDIRTNKFDLICKVIHPPKSNKDETDHLRKLHSYQVEAYFYKKFSSKLLDVGIPIPKVHYVNICEEDSTVVLLMNNLSLDFPISKDDSCLNKDEVNAALQWLSRFHAYNWENYPLWTSIIIANSTASTTISNNSSNSMEQEMLLWPEGCYWYLNTRRKEYNNIGKEWIRLKYAASIIASLLNNNNTTTSTNDHIDNKAYRFKTLIHGDFKSANLLFQQHKCHNTKKDGYNNNNNNNSSSSDTYSSMRCAAYDFQYTGGGYGVRDLAQLIISSMKFPKNCTIEQYMEIEYHFLSSYYKLLIKDINEFLTYDVDYRIRLNTNMNILPDKINTKIECYSIQYPIEFLLKHYELALLDYVRFMAGWGFWGNGIDYAIKRSLYILHTIDHGKCLTEEQYNIEFRKKYSF